MKTIGPFPSSKNSHFQNEVQNEVENILTENEICLHGNKNCFHINGFALSWALKHRLQAAGKWHMKAIVSPSNSAIRPNADPVFAFKLKMKVGRSVILYFKEKHASPNNTWLVSMEGVLTLRDISSALALFYVLLQGTFSIALLIAHLSPVSY